MTSSSKKRKADSQLSEPVQDGTPLNGTGTSSQSELSRVAYVGHLPHGFFEKEIFGFFGQFGKVTRVRVSRNKRTANAKGYAFVEFQHQEVAKIAADTMDGYFMFRQKLQCHVLKKDDVHPLLFKGANRVFKKIPWHKIEAERLGGERTPEQYAKRIAKALVRDKKRQQKILQAGIDFTYEPLSALAATAAATTTPVTAHTPAAVATDKAAQAKIASAAAATVPSIPGLPPIQLFPANGVHASTKIHGAAQAPGHTPGGKSASKKPAPTEMATTPSNSTARKESVTPKATPHASTAGKRPLPVAELTAAGPAKTPKAAASSTPAAGKQAATSAAATPATGKAAKAAPSTPAAAKAAATPAAPTPATGKAAKAAPSTPAAAKAAATPAAPTPATGKAAKAAASTPAAAKAVPAPKAAAVKAVSTPAPAKPSKQASAARAPASAPAKTAAHKPAAAATATPKTKKPRV